MAVSVAVARMRSEPAVTLAPAADRGSRPHRCAAGRGDGRGGEEGADADASAGAAAGVGARRCRAVRPDDGGAGDGDRGACADEGVEASGDARRRAASASGDQCDRADDRSGRRRAQGRVPFDGMVRPPTSIDQAAGLDSGAVADERPAGAIEERLHGQPADPDRPAGAARRVGGRRLVHRCPDRDVVGDDRPDAGWPASSCRRPARCGPRSCPDDCAVRWTGAARQSDPHRQRLDADTSVVADATTASEAPATPVLDPTRGGRGGAVGGEGQRHDHRDAAPGAAAGDRPSSSSTDVAVTRRRRSR